MLNLFKRKTKKVSNSKILKVMDYSIVINVNIMGTTKLRCVPVYVVDVNGHFDFQPEYFLGCNQELIDQEVSKLKKDILDDPACPTDTSNVNELWWFIVKNKMSWVNFRDLQ